MIKRVPSQFEDQAVNLSFEVVAKRLFVHSVTPAYLRKNNEKYFRIGLSEVPANSEGSQYIPTIEFPASANIGFENWTREDINKNMPVKVTFKVSQWQIPQNNERTIWRTSKTTLWITEYSFTK